MIPAGARSRKRQAVGEVVLLRDAYSPLLTTTTGWELVTALHKGRSVDGVATSPATVASPA